MFKDEYNKQFEDIAPSPALNEETIALMQEAQEHPIQAPAKPQKLRWVLPVCVSSAAAMLALTIGLAFWFSRPEKFNDIMGDHGELFLQAGESEISGNIGNNSDSSDMLGGAPNLNSAPDNDNENKPSNDADDGSNAGASDSQAGNSSSNSGSTSSDATIGTDEGATGEPDENKGTDAGENADPEKTPEDETVEDPAPEQPDGNAPQSTPPAEPVDPRAPVEINDNKTETYLSIRAYLDALAAKKTIGYKTNYLAEESLIIVPSWLPTTSRFRQLYAYANGGYEYSYLFSYNETEYFLNISVAATLPKTQRDLNLRVKGLENEDRSLKKMKDQWICYYGNYDKATVTVCTLDGKFIPMAETAEMLGNFDLARYTVQNGLVELTY